MFEHHPNFLNKNGEPQFVVLPYEEYMALRELVEDAEDLLDLRAAKARNADEPTIPLEEIEKRYK